MDTTKDTDLRQERGRLLSNDKRIKHIAGVTWLVPSQTQTAGGYIVNVADHTCTCPDFELRRCRCKHQRAVSFVQTVETDGAGNTTVTETLSYSRTTHGQNWTAYNQAQMTEKETVQALLRGLCEGVKTPEHAGRGPKPIPLSDVVFAMTMKTYGLMSARRATCDIEASAEAGNMSRAPHYNSTLAAFSKPEMTAILTSLIERSAAPLAAIETSFAVDSTGFGTCVYHRWYDEKYGRPMKKATWLKAHSMVGTTTNVIYVGQGHGQRRRGLSAASRAGGVHQAALRDGAGFCRPRLSIQREPDCHRSARRCALCALQGQQSERWIARVAQDARGVHVQAGRVLGSLRKAQQRRVRLLGREKEVRSRRAIQDLYGSGERDSLQGALPEPFGSRPGDAPPWYRAELLGQGAGVSYGRKLTGVEQTNTLVALRILRTRMGTWRLLAKALGFQPSTLRNVRKRQKRVSINMAFAVSRLACVSFDDVTAGKWPAPGTCPHCGRAS
jgi:hypothetical protein